MGSERNQTARLAKFAALLLIAVACAGQPDAPCLIGASDAFDPRSTYLVQLRPAAPFPAECPQGAQYQLILAQRYAKYHSEDPATVVFQLAGSTVDPSRAQASGTFTSFRIVPPSNVCVIPAMTSATDDSVTPVGAPGPVAETTYSFSDAQVLSDTAHLGNQFQARALVNYGVPGCLEVEYVAQGVFPLTPCIDDSICLPEAVATDIPFPGGRGLGSQLSPDYRAYCNLDPALFDNAEVASWLFDQVGAGRGAYIDEQGNPEDVGSLLSLRTVPEPLPSRFQARPDRSLRGGAGLQPALILSLDRFASQAGQGGPTWRPGWRPRKANDGDSAGSKDYVLTSH